MKRHLIALALLALGLLAPIAARAECTVPQTSVICDIGRNATYTGTSIGLVPASAATDIFCISAGTSRNVTVRRLQIGGSAGTAITTPVLLYKRSALGTSGTAATGIALPVGVALSPNDQASTAVLTAYTGNPTVAATPVLMDAMTIDLPVTTAAGGNIDRTKTWGSSVDMFSKGITLLKGSTTQLCVNLNGATVATGVLNIVMEWTEQ